MVRLEDLEGPAPNHAPVQKLILAAGESLDWWAVTTPTHTPRTVAKGMVRKGL